MKREYGMYMLFAAVCTAVNLGSQYGAATALEAMGLFRGKPDVSVFGLEPVFVVSLLTGTILGFTAKFLLDKFIVFGEKHETIGHTVRQVVVYGMLAVVTTAVFWGVEILFKIAFHFENSHLVGGFFGLAAGYTIKFFLDKRFVFTESRASGKEAGR
ncbi:MAG: GtrA family protein [Spirochaetales bacterium]|nr:GtrA family protein [Spirochaetales bacterium]